MRQLDGILEERPKLGNDLKHGLYKCARNSTGNLSEQWSASEPSIANEVSPERRDEPDIATR